MNHHIKNLNLAKELTCKTQFLQHVPSSNYLKLVSTIFYEIFIFSPNDSPSKTMKNVFLFHLKSSFQSQNIHFFVIFFPSFPNFPD